MLNNLEITTIGDITKSSKIYFDPSENNNTLIEDDISLIETYNEFKGLFKASEEESNPWLLRFEFDREKMIEKQIKMYDIYYSIYSKFNKNGDKGDDMEFVFSDDNADKLVFRKICR